MVSTDARSWLCPQSRCGKMLPFSHIKPNLTVFHINTNVFPVLAPATDPDFTLTKSHLYHHLTRLRSSRNRKLIWCKLSLPIDDISPAVFDFSCGPWADHSAFFLLSVPISDRGCQRAASLPGETRPTIPDENSRETG